MNGIHDMGGMHGMGSIEPEENEPVFHEPWEGRVYALALTIGRWGRGRNWGSFRYELESIPPADYLRLSYYERWFRALLVDRLVESDLVTQEELDEGHADPTRPRPELFPEEPETTSAEPEPSPRFFIEQRVRARNIHPAGHTRLPRYARDKHGTVVRLHGLFRLQDTDLNGQRLSDERQHVYTVRFAARELWGENASEREAVYVDLWEGYLEPA